AAVDVGEAVLAGEVADGEGLSCVAHDVVIFGESADGAAEVFGRLGDGEVERVRGVGGQHAFGAHESGGDGDGGDAVRAEFNCHAVDHPDDRGFGDVIKNVPKVFVVGPGDGAYDESAGLADEEWRCELAGDDLRAKAGGEHCVPQHSRLLPKRNL